MNVEILEKSPVEKTVIFEVEPKRYQKSLDQILNDVRKTVAIPGFRKGKAPRAIIIKKVGMDALKKDLLEKLIPDVSVEVMDEKKIVPISTPVCTNYDSIVIEEGKPIKFELTFEVKPEFEMAEYKGLELEKTVYELDPEDLLKKQITNLQEQAGTMKPIEEERGVTEGDVAHVDFESRLEDGTPVSGGSAKDYYMTVDRQNFIPGFVEHIEGKKAGETFEFDVVFPENYPERNLAGKNVKFKMILHAIMKKELPALDDEFAKSMGKYETYAQMEESFRKKIEEHIDQQYRYQLQDKIMKALVDKMPELPVPQALIRGHQERFLKNLASMLQRQNKTLEDHIKGLNMTPQQFLSQIEPQALEAAKGELILDKISSMEDVKVADEEIDAEVAKVAQNLNQSVEMIKRAMERDNYLPVISYEIRNRKIFDIIIENAKITEKKFEDFEQEVGEEKKDGDASTEEA